MPISQRLIDRAYRQRIITDVETRPLRLQEVSRRELRRIDATIRDLRTLMALTEAGRPAGGAVLARGAINNYGPERLAVQTEGDKIHAVSRRLYGLGRGVAQVMSFDRVAVHADARSKYATALALRNAVADQIGEQDWMITTLRGLANMFSGLLTKTT